jgi:polar amino acid transport system permease protein
MTDRSTMKIVPERHYGRWAGVVVVILLLAGLANFLITNERWNWPTVAKYLFDPDVIAGVGRTIVLTVIIMALSIIFGCLVAVMRLSPNPVLSWATAGYIWFFRGVPPLVLLLFVYFLAALLPQLVLGIPYGPTFFAIDTNSVINQWTAAILAFTLAESAYVSEIFRGGILAIDKGQSEAASALGMNRMKTLRRIILPQTMRIVIPPLGNEVIGMIKGTSLVSVIALAELLTTVQQVYARNYQQIPLLMVAVIWYLVLVTVAQIIQHFVEKRFARSITDRTPSRKRSTKKQEVGA